MHLEQWLRQNSKLKRDFAVEIGVTPQMISAYLKGDIWPSKKTLLAITEKTGGAVTANDFLESGAQQ